MTKVNAEILRWARETAHLSPLEAAEKINLREAYGLTAVERLAQLEAGEAEPSRAMLVRMSKHYRRPLLTFYLSGPPPKGDRGHDFRTLPDDPRATEEALLDALLRELKARQSLLRAAVEDEEEATPLPFIGSIRQADGVETVLTSMRETLGLSLEDFRSAPDANSAFEKLREHTGAIGVFVLLKGNLGSWHTTISLSTFRGIALADPIAPFVVVNPDDARSAWSFTLLHELTHLWLGESGISGGIPTAGIERFCNDVASEFLLPAYELHELEMPDPFDLGAAADLVSSFARARNVSSSMVAYKLYRNRAINLEQWKQLSQTFRTAWLRHRGQQREKNQASEGGPSYWIVRQHRVGRHLVGQTARLMASGILSTSKAGLVLGVKPSHVDRLIEATNLSAKTRLV